MKTGIVLEGGAMRGLYSAGVLDVIMEEGIEAEGLVGVSAGAAFGCNYKSKQIGRAIRYNTKYCNDPRYGSIKSFLKTGDIFDVEFCYKTLPYELDPMDWDTFEKNPVEFYAVSTDMETGEAVYFKAEKEGEETMKMIQSSASMPLVSKPVLLNGREYLDGGISDAIPIKWFQSQGYEKNIVILTRPYGYRKKKSKMALLVKLMLRKYPKIVHAMNTRHIRYNETLDALEQMEKEGKVLLFYPPSDVLVKRTESDPKKLQAIYEAGRKDALKRLDELKRFVEK